jgi:hypothetical protein
MKIEILLVLMGIVGANFIITLSKFRRGRILDGIVDASFLVLICYLFRGSFSALVVGAGASLIMSIYILIFPFANPVVALWRRIERALFLPRVPQSEPSPNVASETGKNVFKRELSGMKDWFNNTSTYNRLFLWLMSIGYALIGLRMGEIATALITFIPLAFCVYFTFGRCKQ